MKINIKRQKDDVHIINNKMKTYIDGQKWNHYLGSLKIIGKELPDLL